MGRLNSQDATGDGSGNIADTDGTGIRNGEGDGTGSIGESDGTGIRQETKDGYGNVSGGSDGTGS